MKSFSWAFFIVSLTTSAAIAEGTTPPELLRGFLSPCFERSEVGMVPKANCEFTYKNPDSPSITYRSNRMGLRDKDFPLRTAKTKSLRVLLMGSLIDGFNLPDDQIAARQLEQNLKALGFKNVEVINASISGFRTARYAAWLPRLLEEYKPDVVIYYFLSLQILANRIEAADPKNAPDGWPILSSGNRPPGFRGFLANRLGRDNPAQQSAYWNAFLRLGELHSIFWANLASRSAQVDELLKSTRDSLMQMNTTTTQHGAKLLVLWSPSPILSNRGPLTSGLGPVTAAILRRLTPSIAVSVAETRNFLSASGVELVNNEFTYHPNLTTLDPASLSSDGVQKWVSATSGKIADYLKQF